MKACTPLLLYVISITSRPSNADHDVVVDDDDMASADPLSEEDEGS